ncbi:MAG: glycosyltransferase family 2 protein [Clostridia bacterium]|nr:glycosyltransferase family 2 protein [Clostridia bacterium]
MKTLSVIMPVYNAAPFIGTTIGDLLSQTLKDLEIIAVDDGSTDGTGELLDGLARKDGRIRVIHRQNGGAPSARNAGLDHAEGRYVGFTDSDDRVDPEMYERMVAAAEKTGADVVSCGFVQEYSDKIGIVPHHEENVGPIVFEGRRDCLDSIEERSGSVATYTWNKIIRKDLIGSLRFCEDMRITDDLIFIYHLFEKAEKVVNIRIPFYHYRYTLSGLTKASRAEVYLHELERIDELIEWSAEHAPHCREKLIRRYLFWNTKGCESMLRDSDGGIYRQFRSNIRKYAQYIGSLKPRRRILVRAAKTAWWTYKIAGEVNLTLKKLFVKTRNG